MEFGFLAALQDFLCFLDGHVNLRSQHIGPASRRSHVRRGFAAHLSRHSAGQSLLPFQAVKSLRCHLRGSWVIPDGKDRPMSYLTEPSHDPVGFLNHLRRLRVTGVGDDPLFGEDGSGDRKKVKGVEFSSLAVSG